MSTVPTNINNYLRQFAHELEERILQQFPPFASARRTVPCRTGAAPPNPLSRAGSRDRRDFEALGGRELRRRNRRMRYRKDFHLSRSYVSQFERRAFHCAGNGATAAYHQMVQRNVADSAPSPSVSDRRRPQWRGFEWTYGGERSTASQRTDRARRPSDNTQRFAASEAVQICSRAVAVAV